MTFRILFQRPRKKFIIANGRGPLAMINFFLDAERDTLLIFVGGSQAMGSYGGYPFFSSYLIPQPTTPAMPASFGNFVDHRYLSYPPSFRPPQPNSLPSSNQVVYLGSQGIPPLTQGMPVFKPEVPRFIELPEPPTQDPSTKYIVNQLTIMKESEAKAEITGILYRNLFQLMYMKILADGFYWEGMELFIMVNRIRMPSVRT